MSYQGYYEVETVDAATGEIVQYHKSQNLVYPGFIGGLYYKLFGVGNTANITDSTDQNKYCDGERAYFGRLFLFKDSSTPAATDSADPTNYQTDESGEGKGYRDLTVNGNISSYSVAVDPSTYKYTLTFQVTFSTNEAIYTSDGTQTTWNSIGISSIPISRVTNDVRLLTRVKMTNGILKTNTQTLRVRYNFSIIVG